MSSPFLKREGKQTLKSATAIFVIYVCLKHHGIEYCITDTFYAHFSVFCPHPLCPSPFITNPILAMSTQSTGSSQEDVQLPPSPICRFPQPPLPAEITYQKERKSMTRWFLWLTLRIDVTNRARGEGSSWTRGRQWRLFSPGAKGQWIL